MKLDVLSKEDCEQVRLWRNASLETLRTPYPLTKEMQEDFYEGFVSVGSSRHRFWAIYEARLLSAKCYEDVLIGMGGFTEIEWENSQAEISLILDPEHREKGYGQKAIERLLEQAFNHMHLDLVYGECYNCNAAIIFWERIVEKYRGTTRWLRKGKFYQGRRYETMYFDIDSGAFNDATEASRRDS